MTQNEIATKQDLQHAEERILKGVEQLVVTATANTPTQAPAKKFLRTREVLKFLGISENKLKDMRLKREIPFSKLGVTYFYPQAEIIDILNNNLVPALLK